ncbi:MAG TPA: biopolymer transporter ExbD [Bryobacteraceae bacterium]|jgi:biopolymer transport protein ExbD|nr:biopolymer transporter ExbD [Bryobacteraceae bacterium]
MAFSVNGGSVYGGVRRSFRGGAGTLAEINIVPLVDVVLVLLIIFMLTAHVMEFGMEVNVPKVRNVRDTAEVLPVVNVTSDGRLFLIDQPVNVNEIADRIAERFPSAQGVYVRADKDTPWDVIAQVFNIVGKRYQIRAVTQPEENLGAGKK